MCHRDPTLLSGGCDDRSAVISVLRTQLSLRKALREKKATLDPGTGATDPDCGTWTRGLVHVCAAKAIDVH